MRRPPILSLRPGLSPRPWGGTRLQKIFAQDIQEKTPDPIGETWSISIHPLAPSKADGQPLNTLISPEQMPYLVKLIDTADHLSIQVHPDNEFAHIHENAQGKSECWLILDAHPGCGIYLGLRSNVSKKAFEKALDEEHDMSEYLDFYEVAPGDFFYVPAGTPHAIGKGLFLAEIQQNSGITYRIWDWSRKDARGRPRELHIEKAMKVIAFDIPKDTKEYFKIQTKLFQTDGPHRLIHHPQFCVTLYRLKENKAYSLTPPNPQRVHTLLILAGKGRLKKAGKTVDVSPYQAYLIEEGEAIITSLSSLHFIHIG